VSAARVMVVCMANARGAVATKKEGRTQLSLYAPSAFHHV